MNNGLLMMIEKYSTIISLITILLPALIIGVIVYVRKNLFSNNSKTTEATEETEQECSSGFIDFYAQEGMYVSFDHAKFTGVVSTEGVPYPTYSEDEKNAFNAAYVNFLRTINFPFSKSIISKKIDIERTEKIYQKPLLKLKTELEEVLEDIQTKGETDDKKKRLFKIHRDISYLEEQMNYLDTVSSAIQGTTKVITYSASGELDDEALKTLETDKDKIMAYKDVTSDRMNVIEKSLKACGVKTQRLDDIQLLDLARLHYKPYTSTVYKTHQLLENVTPHMSVNREIMAKVRLADARLKKSGGRDV